MSSIEVSGSSAHAHPPGPSARLLLVFEDCPFLHALSHFLALEGFQVDAADAPHAAARLAAAPCHLLLSDLDSGLTLLRQMRLADVPLLIIAGCDMVDRVRQAVQMGAFAFLIKPIIDDELRQVIQRGLQTPGVPASPRWQAGLPLECTSRWRHRRATSQRRRPPVSI